jgi:hypothetical protein
MYIHIWVHSVYETQLMMVDKRVRSEFLPEQSDGDECL